MKLWKPRFPRIRLPSLPYSLVADVLLLVVGFGAIARGLWLVYPPAMWIVCGTLLMVAGLPERKGAAK